MSSKQLPTGVPARSDKFPSTLVDKVVRIKRKLLSARNSVRNWSFHLLLAILREFVVTQNNVEVELGFSMFPSRRVSSEFRSARIFRSLVCLSPKLGTICGLLIKGRGSTPDLTSWTCMAMTLCEHACEGFCDLKSGKDSHLFWLGHEANYANFFLTFGTYKKINLKLVIIIIIKVWCVLKRGKGAFIKKEMGLVCVFNLRTSYI